MSFRRIVIGVDFSTASLNAVRWVSTRFAPRAELFLVHVVSRPYVPEFLRTHVKDAGDPLSDEPMLYPGLSGFADLAGASRAKVAVRQGRPADELAAHAYEVGADLICVGRSGRRRGTGRFGATTPQRLLARTSLSVLLVPSDPRPQPTTVLAAVSDGDEARQVLEDTAVLAESWDARVELLHALDAGVGAVSATRLTETWLARRATDVSITRDRVTTIGHIGDAADAIITCAVRANSDLIVMGRRVGSRASRSDFGCVGSTTRLITWTAPCPVLVTGTERAEQIDRAPDEVHRAWRWDETRAVRGRRPGSQRGQPSPVPPGGGDAA